VDLEKKLNQIKAEILDLEVKLAKNCDLQNRSRLTEAILSPAIQRKDISNQDPVQEPGRTVYWNGQINSRYDEMELSPFHSNSSAWINSEWNLEGW